MPISIKMLQVLKDATIHGVAVLGVHVKATIKEVNSILLIIIFVTKTLDKIFFMGNANSTRRDSVTPYYFCYTIDPFGLSKL